MTKDIKLKKKNTTGTDTLPLPRVNGSNSLSFRQQKVHYDDKRKFSFSFSCFDRKHELFNLSCKNKPVSSSWFLTLLDCLETVSELTIAELKAHRKFQLHRVDWDKANAKCPMSENYDEFYQFRLNKSKGRVVGFFVGNVFYVVWLDYHHNLTSCEGYGCTKEYKYPLSDYELLELKLNEANKKIEELENDIDELLAQ